MPPSAVEPPFDQLLATAEAVARDRPEVDLELAREVFLEAATLLHNGLALDGLDEHDASAVRENRRVALSNGGREHTVSRSCDRG